MRICLRLLGGILLVCAGGVWGQTSDTTSSAQNAVVNFSDLAAQPRVDTGERATKPLVRRNYRPAPIPESVVGSRRISTTSTTTAKSTSSSMTSSLLPNSGPGVAAAPAYSSTASPPPSAGFQALPGDLSTRRPDTQGAVGPNHLMTTLSSEIRIQDRQGGVVSTVSLNSFWAGLRPNLTVFDPHILYEPYGQRFLFTAEANPGTTNAGILLAISQTSNPTGNWNRYFIPADPVYPVYGLAPNVGFNKNWIVIQTDTYARTNFSIGTNTFTQGDFVNSKVFVINKGDLYANLSNPSITTFIIDDGTGAQIPAQTYDPSLEQIYLMNNYDGSFEGYGYMRIYTISGGATAPFLVDDAIYATPLGVGQDWADSPPFDNFGPQFGSTTGIMAGDSTLGSVIYRGGSLFTVHTEYFPASAPTNSAVVMWEVAPQSGDPLQRVAIGGPNAQSVRTYASMAVNARFDILIAYSVFSSAGYPATAYAFRSGGGATVPEDVPGTIRSEVILKFGDAPYVRTNSAGQNSWGDWSATVVDPINDVDLWTLQEYAATPVGGTNRWATWWGRVSPFVSLSASMTATPNPILAGGNLTYNITVLNERDAATTGETGVRLVDPLPLGATFVSASASQGSCALSNNAVVCDIGLLRDGAQATATIVVTVNTAGSITNSATVSANGIDFDSTDDTATVVTTVNPSADVAIAMTDLPDPINVSGLLTYSILVTNPGPSAATAVTVRDTFSSVMTNISASASIGVCSTNGSTLTCNLGTLLAGSSASVTVRVIPGSPGNVTNTASITATSQDPVSANNSATVTTRVNARPTITAITNRTTLEDTPLAAIPFTIGDAETPAASLTLSATSSDLTVIPLSNITFGGSGVSRSVTVTPAPNQFGNVTVSIVVTDADGAINSSSFVVSISPVNDLPTLDPIADLAINEDISVPVTLTGITSGAPNESQVLVITASSSSQAVIPNPQVVYTSPSSSATLNIIPATEASGSATITVTVNDGGTSNNLVTRTFTVTVNSANDAPTLDPIANLIVLEDSSQQSINLTGITSGAVNEVQALTVTATSSDRAVLPDPGVVYSSPNSTGTLLLAPPTNAFGVATVTVTVNDGGASNNITTRSFTVSINPVNDAPTIDALADISLVEDSVPQAINLNGITSGAANENQTLAITASSSDVSVVPNPAISYTSPNSTGSLVLSPLTNAFGTVIITVRVDDGGSSNNVTLRTFTVTVNGVNDSPSLDALNNLSLLEDAGPTIVTLSGISPGPANENQTVVLSATSSAPLIIPNPDVIYSHPNTAGTLTIVPVANAFGTVTIAVSANDGGLSNNITVRTFEVTIQPENDFPTLDPIADISILEGSGPQAIGLTGISSGAANENQVLSITTSSTDPSLTGNLSLDYTSPADSGTLRFLPPPDASGTAIVTIRIDDGGLSNNVISRSFVVNVLPVNDAPTLDPIANLTIDEDSGAQLVNLTGITSGAPNENQTLTITASSSNPQAIPTPVVNYASPGNAGTLLFAPTPNASGVVTITVTVNDGGETNALTSRAFTVTINPINDLPAIVPLSDDVTLEDTPLTIPLQLSDVETPIDQLLLEGNSSNEELISSADITFGGTAAGRTATIRPLPDQFGSATITITVRDLDGATATSSFELVVFPVNDAPTVLGIGTLVMDEDTTLTIPFSVFDPESIPDDITVSAFSATPQLVPPGNFALAGFGGSFTLTVTPAPNQFGLALINLICSDPDGGISTNVVRVTVTSVNDLPVISAVSPQSVLEDTPTAPISITIGDIETPADNLTLSGFSSNPAIVSSDSFHFSGTGANRTVVILPNTNANGNVFVTIVVHDEDGGSASNSFPLAVTPVNDAPVFSEIPLQRIQQDATKVVSFTLDDPETPANLSLTATSSNPAIVPNGGLLLGGIGTARTLAISPRSGQLGDTLITLTARDPESATSTRTFLVKVTSRPFISSIDPQGTREDVPAGPISFRVADLETPADALTVTAGSSNPTLVPVNNITFGGTGSNRFVTIVPTPNASGQSTITLVVHDLDEGFASSSFVFNVGSVNDLPGISPIPDQITGEDTGRVVNFTLTDVETSLDDLVVHASVGNTALVSSAVFGGSGSNRTLSLLPAPDQFGTTPVTVVVTDSDGGSASTTFLFTINPVNDVPTLNPIADVVVDEDAGSQSVALTGIGAGATNENQALSITVSSGNPALIPTPLFAYNSPGATATLTFKSATNANGTAAITVTVNDGSPTNNSFSRTFQITVNPINDPPTISALADQGTDEDTVFGPLAFTVGDIDGTADLTVTPRSSNPALVPNSSMVINGTGADRTITITPQPNQNGTTVIVLTVQDSQGATATSSFNLKVNPVDDAPTISPVANQTINEDTSTSAIPFVIGDLESAATILSVTARSSNQQLLPDANILLGGSDSNRTVRLTPGTNQSGSSTVILTVRDPEGLSTTTSFVLSVTAVNDAPTVAPLPDQTIAQNSILGLPLSIADVDSNPASMILSASSSNSTLVPTNNIVFGGSGLLRTVQITPVAGLTGTSTITITVSDGLDSSSRSFVLAVNAGSQPPSLNPIANLAIPEDSGLQTVPLSGITGANTLTASSGNPNVIPNPAVSFTPGNSTGSLTFTPRPNSNGTALVTVTAGNAVGQIIRTFLVTVNSVEDTPTLGTIGNQTTREDTPISFPLTLGDIDTPSVSLIVRAISTNSALLPSENVVVHGAGTNRIVTISPGTNQTGTASVVLSVSDGFTTNNSAPFTLTVIPVNDPPTLDPIKNVLVIAPGSGTLNQNVAITGISRGGGPDETNGTVNITATSSATGVFVTPTVTYTSGSSTGLVRLTTVRNATGTSLITVTVDDGLGSNNTVVQTFTAYLRPSANSNPTISPIANVVINEDATAGPISFTVGDSSTSPGSLNVTARSLNTNLLPASGVVLGGSGANRTITLTPAPNQFGTSVVRMAVVDSQFGLTNADFELAVIPLNDAPVISTIAAQSIAGDVASAPIGFYVNDIDTPLNSLVLTATSSNPTLIQNTNIVVGGGGTNRALILNPAPGQAGSATVTVSVSDGITNASTSFNVTVTSGNHPPTLAPIADQSTLEDTATAAIPLTISDPETPAANLTVSATSSSPTLVNNLALGGAGANRTLVLTPVANQSGIATITVIVSDTDGASSTNRFVLTVTPVNDPPTLDPISNLTINEGTGLQTVNLTGIAAGAGEGNLLAIIATSSNPDVVPNPVVTYTSPASSGSLSLAPLPGTNGSATISVTVNDGQGQNNTVTRTFVVAVNDKPSISPVADQVSSEDLVIGPLTFTVSDRDTPAGSLNLNVSSSNASLIPNANLLLGGSGPNRTLQITPLPNQFGNATITITATDSNNLSNTRSFVVAVLPVNNPPGMGPIADLLINEDAGPQTVTLSGITAGPANEGATLSISARSSNPALIPDPIVNYSSPGTGGTLTLTPALHFNGSATITVSLTDSGGQNNTVTRTFTVTVNPVNDPPAFDPISNVVLNENAGPQILTLTGIAPGPTDEVQVVTLSAISSNTGLIPDPLVSYNGGTIAFLSFSPAPNNTGSSVITVTANDGAGQNNLFSRTFTISIAPANDSPTLDPLANISIDEDSGARSVNLTGISAGFGDTQTLAISASSSNPSLIPNPVVNYASPGSSGNLTFAPVAGSSGSAIITVSVNDGSASFDRTFVVNVSPINHPPTLGSIADLSINEDASLQTISFSGVSAGANENQVLSITAASSNPALIPTPAVIYTSPASGGSLNFEPLPNASGTAVITVTVNDGGAENSFVSRSFTVIVNPINDPPIFDAIADQTIDQDSGLHTVSVAGISAGPLEIQTLSLTASSDNATLIASPTILYSSPDDTAALTFSPVAGAIGTTTITVILRDDGGQGGGSALTFQRVFHVTVQPRSNPTNTSPFLRIDKTESSVVLSWPADATGFVLQSKLAFDPANTWTGTSDAPLVVGGRCFVTNSLSGFARFYQLVKSPDTGNEAPGLRIERVGQNVVVSWPTNASGYTLQSKPAFDAASFWTAVSDLPSAVGNRFYVTNSLIGFSRFYQLAKVTGPPERPTLSISKSGNTVTVSWPASTSTFILERAFQLESSADWSPVGITSVVNGTTESVTIPSSGFLQFFRLRKL